MTTPAQALIRGTENRLFAEISELKSQVEDLQEELGNVLDERNQLKWQVEILEDKLFKRRETEDRED